jgi:purine-nucleoside/S-methyl-5'-thioadenosine phosphorylase / adenosine deaminase
LFGAVRWRENSGLRWLEADLGAARAAFTTRLGGVSEPPFDSLNLGLLTADEPAAVAENRRRLAAALGIAPDRIAFARQVHGADLLTHTQPPLRCSFASGIGAKEQRKLGVAGADGHVVGRAGVAGLVFVADCLPVALAGPGGVAVLHCGWRGMAAGIIAAGAEAVEASAAAIGPGIGPCCYEVGDEVLEAFSGLGKGVSAADGPKSGLGVNVSARRRLDLPEVARRLLVEAGVGRVESAGLCTRCEPQLFFSHRRDGGRSGRQAGLAWLESAEA